MLEALQSRTEIAEAASDRDFLERPASKRDRRDGADPVYRRD